LRFGPRGAGFVPFGRGLTLGRLRLKPHGIDLGPLEPSLPRRLYTKSRRIELAPGRLVEDLERLRLSLEAPANGGLTLVGGAAALQQLLDAQQRAPGAGQGALHAADASRGRDGPRAAGR
jgi:hypothetical protein